MAADPKAQGMFDGAVRQGLQAVTSPEVHQRVAQDAQTRGPAFAIAEAVSQALAGVDDAAKQSGIQVPREVMEAAAVAIAQIMIAMMADAGMVDDPQKTQADVMAMFKGEAP